MVMMLWKIIEICIEIVPGNSVVGPKIAEMWEQEKVHKAKFDELINKYRVRPTALLPIWNIAGFALGAGKHFHLSFHSQ